MPNRFLLDVPDPTTKILEGLQIGSTIKTQRQATQKQAAIDEAIAGLGLESTAEDYAKILPQVSPEQAEAILKGRDLMTTEQKSNVLQFMQQLVVAPPETSAQLARDRAEAYRNSGDDTNAQAMETVAKLYESGADEAADEATLVMMSLIDQEATQAILDIRKSKVGIAAAEAGIDLTVATTRKVIAEALTKDDMREATKENLEANTKLLEGKLKEIDDKRKNIGTLDADLKREYAADLR